MKEKDLNYIAKVEKAIKKKYGEEAIQNPSKFWDSEKEKIYLEQLKDLVSKQREYETKNKLENVNGILITRKLFSRERKLNCSVCQNKIKTLNDNVYITKFDCCEKCYVKYVEGREDRWLEGWRPDNVKKST